jgi:hypothetical protein
MLTLVSGYGVNTLGKVSLKSLSTIAFTFSGVLLEVSISPSNILYCSKISENLVRVVEICWVTVLFSAAIPDYNARRRWVHGQYQCQRTATPAMPKLHATVPVVQQVSSGPDTTLMQGSQQKMLTLVSGYEHPHAAGCPHEPAAASKPRTALDTRSQLCYSLDVSSTALEHGESVAVSRSAHPGLWT